MLIHQVMDRRAWTRSTIRPIDWTVELPAAAIGELDDLIQHLRQDPLPVLLLSPDLFPLPVCARVMAAVRRKLDTGPGLVVLDRLPVDRWSREESSAAYWILASMLGRLVAQKWDGTMIYDVRDTGRTLEYGVRRSVTNLELLFHTDAPWLELPPELVGLLCLRPAQHGGMSRFVSLLTVHNELRRRQPSLLPRLYRPFPWDRQAEHAPGDGQLCWQPVFQSDAGSVVGRLNEALILSGADLAGIPLDLEAVEALAAMREILEDPEFWVELTIERGQIQHLNNHCFAHSRTRFQDAPEPERKRHLIRLWNRDRGRRTFRG
jgi:alpha-ketoglutarate-dependent taurine dioxygenase